MTRFSRFPGHQPRRSLALLAAAATATAGVAVATVATSGSARAVPSAADRTLAAVPADHGLTVVIHDGYLSAQGAAADVHTAAGLFAGIGDIAVYSGPDQTGTGTLAVAVDPPGGDDWVELQTADMAIASAENNYNNPFGVYDAAGKLLATIDAHGTKNVSPAIPDSPDPRDSASKADDSASKADDSADSAAKGMVAGSPGFPGGDAVHIPASMPLTICGDSIDVIALFNPALGNICENAGLPP
jgi:hypothetical protein